jgi:hypothetical protein
MPTNYSFPYFKHEIKMQLLSLSARLHWGVACTGEMDFSSTRHKRLWNLPNYTVSPRGEGSCSNEGICDTTADIVVLVPVCGGSFGCGFGGGL